MIVETPAASVACLDPRRRGDDKEGGGAPVSLSSSCHADDTDPSPS